MSDTWDWAKIQETLRQPKVISGDESDFAKADVPALEPHGEFNLEVDFRPDDLVPLPGSPRDYGIYMYLGAAYKFMGLDINLFELYHANTDNNVKRLTYMTHQPMLEIAGSRIHEEPESHRLQWVKDEKEAVEFVDFVSSYIFKRTAKKQLFALGQIELTVAWPSNSAERIPFKCLYLLPFASRGAFQLAEPPGMFLKTPVFVWDGNAVSEALQEQEKVVWQSC